MRVLMITAAVLALAACNRGGTNTATNSAGANAAAANTAAPAAAGNASTATASAAPAAGGLPEGFPDSDLTGRSLECTAFLEAARKNGVTLGAREPSVVEEAEALWRASLISKSAVDEDQTEEQVTKVANAASTLPAGQPEAAAAWCVDNAPESYPEG